MRIIPWPSEPWSSASAMRLATAWASRCLMPTFSKAAAAKAVSDETGMRRVTAPLCVTELAHHPVDDALEERRVGILREDHQVAQLEALGELHARALEHRLAALVGEEEARLERAHVEQLRRLARIVGTLAADPDPDAFLQLGRQLHFLQGFARHYGLGPRRGGSAGSAGLRRSGRSGIGRRNGRLRGGGEVELVGLLHLDDLVADLDGDRRGEI